LGACSGRWPVEPGAEQLPRLVGEQLSPVMGAKTSEVLARSLGFPLHVVGLRGAWLGPEIRRSPTSRRMTKSVDI